MSEKYFDSGIGERHGYLTGLHGDIAINLLRHLAISAGDDNGEDSAGRQRIRLMRPEEVAQRACDIAEATAEEFERRGWVRAAPTPEDAAIQVAAIKRRAIKREFGKDEQP